jgi:hypothetical protein
MLVLIIDENLNNIRQFIKRRAELEKFIGTRARSRHIHTLLHRAAAAEAATASIVTYASWEFGRCCRSCTAAGIKTKQCDVAPEGTNAGRSNISWTASVVLNDPRQDAGSQLCHVVVLLSNYLIAEAL